MRYKITYLDKNNSKNIKILNGNSLEEIKANPFIKKNIILNIEHEKHITKTNKQVNIKVLNSFLKQFSILLQSGLDIKFSIDTLHNQEKNKNFKAILKNINEQLNLGYTLSESIESTNSFPSLVIGVIEAGETSSSLPETLSILSNYYETEIKTKQNLKNSLYYPLILIMVTFIVVIAMVTFVLPNFIDLFNSYENIELPIMTRGLIGFSKLIQNYGVLVLVFILIIFIIFRQIYGPKLKFKVDKVLLKFPALGTYLLYYDIQKFSGIFSLLLKSGIETIDSIKISSNSLNNLYIKHEIKKSTFDILNGNTIYNSFNKIKILPTMFLNLVNVGEISSNLVETMNISFNYYKNIVEEESKKLTSLFEPIIIIIVSIVVGSVIIAIAMPMFELVNII